MADDDLANAAGVLLLAGEAPGSDELVRAVRDAGSDAVLVHALFSTDDDRGRTARWLGELRRRADAELVCGEAQSGRARLLIASARGGTLAPLTAASSVVRGTLTPGFSRAELVIADANGRLTRLGLEPAMLRDGIPLAQDLARPATIQLVARAASGPRPVAERVLPSTGARPLGPTPVGEVATPTEASRAELQALLAELRQARGHSPVRVNRLLSVVAQQHAAAVCRDGRLAHQLTPGSDPQARLAQAGVTARLVGETIARASDAHAAFTEFADSPSHLLTLLEPRFTDAGIGASKAADGRACVVVLLAAWPRYVGR